MEVRNVHFLEFCSFPYKFCFATSSIVKIVAFQKHGLPEKNVFVTVGILKSICSFLYI
jgi:hypothetical protein